MRVEEMALRSEIRQMLNEAGLNRETIKQMVKETSCCYGLYPVFVLTVL